MNRKIVNDIESKRDDNTENSKGLSINDLDRIETLLLFCIGFMYFENEKNSDSKEYITKAFNRDNNDYGIRCRYSMILMQKNEYESAYTLLKQTLNILDQKERDLIEAMKTDLKRNNKRKSNDDDMKKDQQIIMHHKFVCHLGCAFVKIVIMRNYREAINHLKECDTFDYKLNVIKYFLSYSYYQMGFVILFILICVYWVMYIWNINRNYDESMEWYHKFKTHIENEESKRLKRINKGDKFESFDDVSLTMNFFKWHPYNKIQSKRDKYIEQITDFVVLTLLVSFMYAYFEIKPIIGHNNMDYIIIFACYFILYWFTNPFIGAILCIISLPIERETIKYLNKLWLIEKTLIILAISVLIKIFCKKLLLIRY